jgi:hypothetical protein
MSCNLWNKKYIYIFDEHLVKSLSGYWTFWPNRTRTRTSNCSYWYYLVPLLELAALPRAPGAWQSICRAQLLAKRMPRAALGKSIVCRASDKIPSTNLLALGIEHGSGSVPNPMNIMNVQEHHGIWSHTLISSNPRPCLDRLNWETLILHSARFCTVAFRLYL